MKTLKFFAALTICAMLVSSCKDDVMGSVLDAEQVIARTPGNSGMYSDYIMSESEAIAMVANDLKNSGGEFAKKQISHVEPVMHEHFMDLYDPEIAESGFVEATDPLFYIVHFKDGGFSIVQPDSRLGAEILYAQTFYTISCEDFYRGVYREPVALDKDSLLCFIPPPIGDGFEDPDTIIPRPYWDNALLQIVNDFKKRLGEILEKYSYPSFKYDASAPWVTYEIHTANTQFFLKSGAPLNPYQDRKLGAIAPAVIGFLGYLGEPYTMFAQTGSWDWLKQNFFDFGNTLFPLPYWAYEISRECKADIIQPLYRYIGDFDKVTPLLNDLGVPSERKVYNNYDRTRIDNSRLTELLRAGKPVLVHHDNKTGLAFQEEMQVKEIYWRGLNDAIMSTIYEYRSKIIFKVSLEDRVGEAYAITSTKLNNNFYYIVY